MVCEAPFPCYNTISVSVLFNVKELKPCTQLVLMCLLYRRKYLFHKQLFTVELFKKKKLKENSVKEKHRQGFPQKFTLDG